MRRLQQRPFLALPYVALALAAVVLLAASPAPETPSVARSMQPNGPGTKSADDVIHLILSRNPSLSSYIAHVHLDIRQLNFPYLHPSIEGTTYYKSPGLVVSTFPHVPFYLKSVNLQQTGAYAATKFKRCYAVSVSQDDLSYHLHMEPYIHSRVKSLDVTVAPDGAIQHMEWRYLQDSRDHIDLDIYYSNVGGYRVITGEIAKIRISHIRAIATSIFDGFQFNVPVPTPTPPEIGHECSNLD